MKIAYLAGIIDGEGCILIHRSINDKGYIGYTLEVGVRNTDGRLIDWLKNNYGGTVKVSSRGNSKHKTCYDWRLFNQKAISLLLLILPYLIVKKEQIEVALKFPVGKIVRNPALREWIYKTLQSLKAMVYTLN